MKLKEKLEKNENYKKYKEYKESFKTIWNDPKIGSIIKLSFWFIIILIVALIVRVNDNTEELPQTTIQEKQEILIPTNEIIKLHCIAFIKVELYYFFREINEKEIDFYDLTR